MRDHLSPKRSSTSAHGWEPTTPQTSQDPVEAYRTLARELQECYPDAEARHLDLLIAQEMAVYDGYSVEAISQAMLAASLALASGTISNAQHYVDRLVDEAMQEDPTQDIGLGWG
jgi:hypothetical protein